MASYSGTQSTGAVKQLIGINLDLKDRCVVVLEDIVDTGITLDTIVRQLSGFEPAEIKVATFLHKPEATKREVLWQQPGRPLNSFIIMPDALLAAGQTADDSETSFLAALKLDDGSTICA